MHHQITLQSILVYAVAELANRQINITSKMD
jgi:hypothetical protein